MKIPYFPFKTSAQLRPSSARVPVHIINPLWNAYGGSERRAVSLYTLLKDHTDVSLWSEHEPHPALAATYPICPIQLRRLHFPRSGVLVFVGIYFYVGRWIRFSRPQRKIVIINTIESDRKPRFISHIEQAGGPPVEIVYASQSTEAAYSMPGVIESSPIDLTVFTTVARPPDRDRFTVGRLSRDHPKKHHADDPAFYRRLIEQGCAIRIMGGRILADRMNASPFLELLPAGHEPAAQFLQGHDCFYYRTAGDYYETYGRVVHEALACGLPVVVERDGGYAEHIEHGVNGFLFDKEDEAQKIIVDLKEDAALRARISRAARESAQRIYSPVELENIRRFYIGDSDLNWRAAR